LATGQTQQGTLISQNGQCPPQPKNCGNIENGQTTWQDDGQTQPYNCGTCVDGTAHLCIATLQQQMVCNNGALNPTGQVQSGTVIGYANSCPNVTPGRETFTVPNFAPKADVLFVLDTTHTMFKTLQTLAYRFRSLISSWKNVDWHLALTNAGAERSFFDPHQSLGHIMELNPFPLEYHPPLRYLTPRVRFADDIFHRDMSFDGMTWPQDPVCDRQPYCQMDPAQPLKEILLTMVQRNDGENHGFFRPGSTFVPVIISAHDENGDGRPRHGSIVKPTEVVDYFKRNMGDMAGIQAYSFIIEPRDYKCLEKYSTIFERGDGGAYGRSFEELSALTGGTTSSLCEKDYGKTLANLSQSVRQQISSMTLQQIPWNDSLKIMFNPSVPGISWVVQGKNVLFNKPLPAGTVLSISYLYSPSSGH
jgi:hypothetical protein